MDLAHWIEGWAGQAPDKPAIITDDETLTYAGFAAAIDRAARALRHELGVGAGDRVAHLGENSVAQLVLFFACARTGVSLVTLNWRLAPPEHGFQLADSGASVLFADPGFIPHADAIPDKLPGLKHVSLGPAEGQWSAWSDLLAAAASGAAIAPEASHETPVLLVYTSGTTGRPKGAVLTQGNVFWNAVNATHAHDMVSTDLILTNLPLFHVGGLNNQTTPAFHAGATVFLQPRFDPAMTLGAIDRLRPTLALAVPAMMQALTDHPDWATTDLSSLRLVMAGSTTVPTALIERFHARGVPVGQIYGSTETSPLAIVLRGQDAFDHVGSCGRPAVHVQVRVVDNDGRDVAEGDAGEILVRGPSVFSGYWQNPDATAEAFVEGGWFRMGDIGRRDADGFYRIEDRAKDVVISGGENIYPAELEQVLAAHADLAEFAVVGRPDPRWGEVPVIFAVPREGQTLDAPALLGLFHDRLARYKHPKDVIPIDALPRNALGKVLKYELRAMLEKAG